MFNAHECQVTTRISVKSNREIDVIKNDPLVYYLHLSIIRSLGGG